MKGGLSPTSSTTAGGPSPSSSVPCYPILSTSPVGYLFFADVFGNGRIEMHSLLVFCEILIIGLVAWKRGTNPAGLGFGLALGILFHQVLDVMWEAPKTRVFSVAPTIRLHHGGTDAFVLLQSDMSARSEWVLAAVIVAAVIRFLGSRRYRSIISRYRTVLAWLMGAGALILVVFTGVVAVRLKRDLLISV